MGYMRNNRTLEKIPGLKFLNDTWLPYIDDKHAWQHYWVHVQQRPEFQVNFQLYTILQEEIKGKRRHVRSKEVI